MTASAPATPLSRAIRDVVTLCIGLAIGFVWALLTRSLQFRETHHIVVGLVVIVGQMLRYLFLCQVHGPESHPKTTLRFFGELAVFLAGLVAGLLWHLFYVNNNDTQPEVHLIVLLLVLIFVIARYLALLRRQAEAQRAARTNTSPH